MTWCSIPGFDGLYQINKKGVVRSFMKKSRSDGGLITGKAKVNGYRIVSIRGKHYKVAYLMMLTFVGPRPSGMEVCHNNGIPDDDRLSNLRYDTPRGNSLDRWKHGTMRYGENHHRFKHGYYSKYV